jgi:two-component system response regulator BasR
LETPSRKVLVVESDEVILALISYLLTRETYAVDSALDALEAEAMLRRHHYEAILLEPRTPNGGIEFLRKLAAADPGLVRKIIVVTSALHEIPLLVGLPLHAIIRKPFEVASLIETVRALVERDR